ncbi:MAG: LysR family transcriptional regulator [Burkholderiales bacterium]|nr:LysR family transcriptional regulator [Burkholderiales bacterium]
MAANRNLDLFTLECFDILMRERSVSRAAERMDMSQSSMSEVLARLRDRLGDPLLVRTREGMVPTERATALLPQVRRAIDQLRLIVERGAEFRPGQAAERFRLTATDYAQLLLVSDLAQRLRSVAPGCTLDLVTVNIRLVEQALEAGEVDLAIAYYPDPPPGLRRGPLFADRYVCIARRGHPAAAQPLGAEGFAELAHVSVSPSGLSYFAGVVDSALDALGLARRVVVKCPHFLIASHLVARSDMVLALPERAARALTALLPVQIVELPFPTRPVDVSMYWHERCHHSRSHQWLREQVRSILGPAPS